MKNKELKSCKNCNQYMKCFMNQIGIGVDKFAEECSFYRNSFDIKEKIGYLLLCLDDWLAKKNIYLNYFAKDKDNHVNILCRIGFKLIGRG